ncbi:MAG: DUF4129 domain-containing protein [Clostridia bacterium]|nr:DUF4129 domain-containing protein [Clostridia bacterium]
MKDRLRVLPMKMLAALCLVMGVIPSSVLLGRLFVPDAPLLWLLLPFAAWIWACAGYLLPNKGRLPFALLGCALLLAWGVLFQWPVDPRRLLLILPCVGLLLALPPAWHRPVWDEWPAGAWFGGIILHLIAQFVSGWPMFEGILPWLLPCFAVFAFLFVLCQNRHSLSDGMHGAGKAPAAIRQRNTALAAVFFLVALAASCWHQLAVWVGAACDFIRNAIIAAVAFLMQLLPAQGGMGGGGGDMSDLLGGSEESEPSALALFFEKVFQAAALLIVLVLAFFAVRALAKGCKRLLQRLLASLRRYAADAGEDYVDETESTVNWDERTQTIRDQVRGVFRREKPEKWESLNGRERVRYLYRQFLRRRPEAQNKTAREALAEEKSYTQNQARAFTDLYEQARYSGRDISEGEADKLRQTIKG